tara:strand:+ start:190 stop:777 length:588 start_codon:yes stop_codon:yes gene_type:complete
MARPVEFDEDKVLTNAMEQFWKEGYEASSVRKLLDCTGINRGTLYNSFGDKDTFFRACVEYYNMIVQKQIESSLKDENLSCWNAIEAYFEETISNVSQKQRAMGCMLVNSLCESVNQNRVLRKLVRDSLMLIRKEFLVRLSEAKANKKLKKGLGIDFAADVLMNTLYGLRVNSRSGRDTKQLKMLVKHSIDSLKK